MYILVSSRACISSLGLGFPCLCGAFGERRRGSAESGSAICDGFPDSAGGCCTRKRCELVGGGLDFCPFLVFSGDYAGVFFGEDAGRYLYQLVEMPGWILDPTIFGGFAPFGVLCDRTAQNNSVLSTKPVHVAIKQ
jgi:hypothetical protein